MDYHGIAVGACDSCKGSWLTGGGFGAVTRMDGAGFSPRDVAKLKVLLEYKVNRSVKPTTHPCPKCQANLRARNYANIAGFFIEQCPRGCGVWVREGDLDRIRILRSLGRFEEVRTAKAGKAPAPAPAGRSATGTAEAAAPKKRPTPGSRTAAAKKRTPRTRPRREREQTASPEGEAEAPRKGFLARLMARILGRGN